VHNPRILTGVRNPPIHVTYNLDCPQREEDFFDIFGLEIANNRLGDVLFWIFVEKGYTKFLVTP
jgi:hypothetical protein